MLNKIDFANYAKDTIRHMPLEAVWKKQLTVWKIPQIIYFACLVVIKWKPILASVI